MIRLTRFAFILVALVATFAIILFSSHQRTLHAQEVPTATATFTAIISSTVPVGPPTSTPTPRPVTEISHPKPGDIMAGIAPILGSTLTTNCFKYQIDIAVTGSETWQTLTAVIACIANNELYRLDTKKFKDGYYDLRLRAIRGDGNYEEAYLRALRIDNSYPPTATPVVLDGVVLPSPTPTLLPIATATQRPKIIQQVPGGQGFYRPEVGETVRGFVEIAGTVNGQPGREFKRSDLFISSAGLSQWTWLHSSEEQIWQNTIYVLDSTTLADGYYDLLLRIVYQDSNYDEYTLRYLRIANRALAPGKGKPQASIAANVQSPGLVAPAEGSTVSGVVEVRGVAVDPSFLRWELYWSPAGLENWAFLTAGQKAVVSGLFAKLDFSKLGSTSVDLRLRIVRQDYNYSEHFARRIQVIVPTPPPVSPLPIP